MIKTGYSWAKPFICFFLLINFTFPISGISSQKYPHPTSKEDSNLADKPHIVFLISEDPDNYEAHRTIPPFAEFLEEEEGYEVTVLQAEGPRNSSRFPGLDVLAEADLLVIFCRRLAIPEAQLKAIKSYLAEGKPVVGIRTANHGFSVREGEIPAGFQDWPEFVPEILGSENRGYGPTEPGTQVKVNPEAESHPIVKDLPKSWHSIGNVYYTAPLLDQAAKVLLTGTVNERVEPIAWTRMANNSRVFYTSLGHPSDFEVPQFRRLLINGIRWALGME